MSQAIFSRLYANAQWMDPDSLCDMICMLHSSVTVPIKLNRMQHLDVEEAIYSMSSNLLTHLMCTGKQALARADSLVWACLALGSKIQICICPYRFLLSHRTCLSCSKGAAVSLVVNVSASRAGRLDHGPRVRQEGIFPAAINKDRCCQGI